MKNLDSVSLLIDNDTLNKMESFYGDSLNNGTTPYLKAIIKEEGVTISIYKENKRGENKVLFQGENALSEARLWDKNAKRKSPIAKLPIQNKCIVNRYPQIGSDEVGTGDFFGPIIVTAAYVKKEDVPFLLELGITDSKKMSDEKILSLGPTLLSNYDYSELCLDNQKFNDTIAEYNMNAIKAKMHNRCLLNLKKRHPEAIVYQDQFAPEELYYSYLKKEKEVLKDINFKTKGETSFISVALASVISRYAFLRKIQKMGQHYGLVFPLGATEKVDEFALSFYKKYGKEEFKKVAKLNFSNAKRLI